MAERYFLTKTSLHELGEPRRGKVRDIYDCGDNLVLVSTDRLSLFDRVLDEPIEDKGKILTGLSRFWFDNTKDIVPNHFVSHPDPNVMIVKKCRPLLVEIVVRAFLVGSLWRDYKNGKRIKSGTPLPEGLKQNDPLPSPIVTPSTKNSQGHDEDISPKDLIRKGILTPTQWEQLLAYSTKLFSRGQEILKDKGIILVDTKYEFGLDEKDRVILIDEIHTPDSSRFWFKEDAVKGAARFHDKEYAREWAMGVGFMGNGPLPKLPDEIRDNIRKGYTKLYEAITGEKLPAATGDILERVRRNLPLMELSR